MNKSYLPSVFTRRACRNPSCGEFFLYRRDEKYVWNRNYCSSDCAEQYTGKFVKGLT